MFASKLFLAAAALALVNAQTPTDTSGGSLPTEGVSTCVLTCVGEASLSTGCTSITDTSCICGNEDFVNAATSCLEEDCTDQEQQEALQLQSQLCGGSSSGSMSGSSSSSMSGSGSSSASDSMSTSSSSGSSSSGMPSESDSEASPSPSDGSEGEDGGDGALAVSVTSLGGVLAAGIAVAGLFV